MPKVMKGKGKGGGGAADRLERNSEPRECPLQFPDLKPVDHARMCPRYTQVLVRTEEDGIGIEELDTLQTELETLLASVAKRMRQVESEMKILSNWAENKTPAPTGKPDKSKGKGPDTNKRGGGKTEEKPSKKFKDSAGKASAPPATVSRPKGKAQTLKISEYEFPESPATKPPEQPRVPKNDAPNRFWANLEPYCMEIGPEHLKVLEDILRSHEDDADYQKVPSLGKHYSHKWAQEDMLEEQREGRSCNGSKPIERRRSTANSSSSSIENNHHKKNSKNEDGITSTNGHDFALPLDLNSDEDTSPFGHLTQRLVAALIEENIMTPLEDVDMETDAAEAATMSPRSLAKQLNVGNAAQLERRIKKELEEQGILDFDDLPDDDPEDEVLNELRRKQQELRVLSQHNLRTTKMLYELAKKEMKRQDLRRRMAAADADVMDAYRKIQMARQKKRTPTKKEKDSALKAMREREQIVKQIEIIES